MNIQLLSNLQFLFGSLLFAGFLIVSITTFQSGENGTTALLSGYATILTSIVILSSVMWMQFQSLSTRAKLTAFVPLGLLVVWILTTVVLISTHFKSISTGKLITTYYTLSKFNLLFLGVDILLLFASLFQNSLTSFSTNTPIKLIPVRVSSISNLISTIGLLITITIGVVLQSYPTQG